MSRFDNKLCPICRKPLTDKSDVVVCPECGTPHHRACYLALGHCGVEQYHAQGFEWKGWLPGEEPPEPEKVSLEKDQQSGDTFSDEHRAEYTAGQSGQPGQNDQSFMGGMDGQPMDIEEFLNRLQHQTMDDTRGEDGVSSKELSTFVGRSVMHYSQAFAAFRAPVQPGQKKRRIFFNAAAGLFAPIHQFYRRMDLVGLAVLLLDFIYYIPAILNAVGIGSTDVLSNIQLMASGASFIVMILMCMFGDYIYYRFAVKRIQKIRMKFDDGRAEGYYEALAAKGTPSWLRAIVAMLAVYLAQAVLVLYLYKILPGAGM